MSGETTPPEAPIPATEVHHQVSPEPGAPPEAPAPSPVVDPAPTPEPAAAAIEPAAEPAFKPHTDTPSLLAQAGKEEPKPDADAPPVVAEPVQPAAPTYEPFTLPEGIEAAPETMAAYTGALGKHGITQEAGQELLSLHAAQMQTYAEQTLTRQHEAFGKMRAEWRDQVMADPEIGGSNHRSAMASIAELRDRFIPRSGPVTDAFNAMLDATGVGDHPDFLRLMARIGRAFREPAPAPAAQKPPADIGRKPNGRATMAEIYPTMSAPR